MMKKPMVSATKVSFFDRLVKTRLSSAAVRILFEHSQLLSEGQSEGGVFLGSTMITIDCKKAGEWVSDRCTPTTVRVLCDLLLDDSRVRQTAAKAATQEAQRLCGHTIGRPQIDMRVYANGHLLHIDVDMEAKIKKARAV